MENKKRIDSFYNHYKENKIKDRIYLGDKEGGRDKKLLKGYGITHILICGSDQKKIKDEFEYQKSNSMTPQMIKYWIFSRRHSNL